MYGRVVVHIAGSEWRAASREGFSRRRPCTFERKCGCDCYRYSHRITSDRVAAVRPRGPSARRPKTEQRLSRSDPGNSGDEFILRRLCCFKTDLWKKHESANLRDSPENSQRGHSAPGVTGGSLASVREIHPEVSFYFWNGQRPMRRSKTSGFGFLKDRFI